MREYETRRLASQGALVLIPATLATGSMMYLVSTVSSSILASILIGLFFGLVVLSIDRYIVSTLHKSQTSAGKIVRNYGNSEDGRNRLKALRGMPILPLLSRVVFTLLLSAVISDPIVLLINSGTIRAQLNSDKTAAVSTMLANAEREKAALNRSSGLDAAKLELTNEQVRSQCLGTLLSDEQSGVAAKLSCGSSSGNISQGPIYRSDLSRKLRLDNVVIPQLQQRVDALSSSVSNKYIAIDHQTTTEINQYLSAFSSDYPARLQALQQVARVHPEVLILEIFLFLFFFSIDLTALFLKLSTPAGVYEIALDASTQEAIVDVLVSKERRRAALESKEVAEAHIAALATEMELAHLIRTIEIISRAHLESSEIIFQQLSKADNPDVITALAHLRTAAADAILATSTRLEFSRGHQL
ncbi:MAG: DUF4407 domain-containing protein [Actinomycetota bacterium]|nr:DUF4407 domain-containing protein [Actinomycetota bacterium]